ncbi:hypothetical protein GGTG_09138 [Gaeumannomyces tritici R3-111a-1]|uniref:Uncharacterized protein n=1 Tax=Gaeumannomyces tritici (strain R3-111a-1) TaxID=644352 RepID=J3P6J7_GAET3|nr:hypothetical protein GGTG_09138 [Gaeumannomyces tritici R3-111a-1]EJT72272.1 hypothetical protein GGTG_09138 [Gaeumannomyces tritici R3-111a-1]
MLQKQKWTWQKTKCLGGHEEMMLGEDLGPEDGTRRVKKPSIHPASGLAPANRKEQQLCRFLLGFRRKEATTHPAWMTTRLAHREAATPVSTFCCPNPGTHRQPCVVAQPWKPADLPPQPVASSRRAWKEGGTEPGGQRHVEKKGTVKPMEMEEPGPEKLMCTGGEGSTSMISRQRSRPTEPELFDAAKPSSLLGPPRAIRPGPVPP